ncbi:MAG: sulfatase-like hydrolase/transferase, partial [Pirellulales bacterium]
DLGYETIGANGGESYQTPNLDRLAATGMRFERCHVQPLCTPTRVQLMTGMYNIRNYTQFGAIDPQVTTFGHLLKDAGYATGIAGKWQLGRGKKLPQRLGFDESCLWQHTRRPPRYANPGLEYNGEERDFNNGEYGPQLVNDFAIDFVTRHKDRPCFQYYPMIHTHAPYVPTPDSAEWNAQARGDKAGRNVKHFADMVAYMDKMIGRLVAKLDELDIRDNTLVIFIGDNGTGREVVSQFKGQAYPGGKGLTTARGMHVPLIANWPRNIPAGRVNGDLIDSTDFLPTLAEAAGAEVPASLQLDGRSFLPQLLGKQGQPREWIYCWYAKNGGPKATAEFAMTATLKLYRDGRVFDLGSDPFEERSLRVADLSEDDAEDARKLQAALDQYTDARPAHLLASAAGPAKKDRASRPGRKQRRALRQLRDEANP